MSITLIKQLQKLDLPRAEKNIAIAFTSHVSESAPEKGAWAGSERLAAQASYSLRTAERSIANLKERRILIFRGYKTGRYLRGCPFIPCIRKTASFPSMKKENSPKGERKNPPKWRIQYRREPAIWDTRTRHLGGKNPPWVARRTRHGWRTNKY